MSASDADAAQQVLVDRIVMIHVELHHRDDAAEGAHEMAKHAGFVHAPQHGLGVVGRGEDFEEEPVRLRIVAQLAVHQLERARGKMHRVGMEGEIVFLRELKDADQVDRIALEHVRIGDIDAVVVDDEIVGLAQRAARTRTQLGHHPAEHGHGLRLRVFELRAQDAR